jgi:hypothetical protein
MIHVVKGLLCDARFATGFAEVLPRDTLLAGHLGPSPADPSDCGSASARSAILSILCSDSQ